MEYEKKSARKFVCAGRLAGLLSRRVIKSDIGDWSYRLFRSNRNHLRAGVRYCPGLMARVSQHAETRLIRSIASMMLESEFA
jgi:hypothetical protein